MGEYCSKSHVTRSNVAKPVMHEEIQNLHNQINSIQRHQFQGQTDDLHQVRNEPGMIPTHHQAMLYSTAVRSNLQPPSCQIQRQWSPQEPTFQISSDPVPFSGQTQFSYPPPHHWNQSTSEAPTERPLYPPTTNSLYANTIPPQQAANYYAQTHNLYQTNPAM